MVSSSLTLFEITNPKILTLSLIYLTCENKLSLIYLTCEYKLSSKLESQVYLTWLSKLEFMSFVSNLKEQGPLVEGLEINNFTSSDTQRNCQKNLRNSG